MFRFVAAMLLFGSLIGCANPDQDRQLAAESARPVTCISGEDCEVKWGRALNWVQDNSHWKLRMASDSLITTEGPFDSVFAAFSITKTPLGNGTYSLDFRAGCGNVFGCTPPIAQLHASFVNTIMGPATSPIELRFGSGAHFGLRMLTIDQQAVETLELKSNKGALVIDVAPGSTASKAGLLKGDIITKLNGNEVASSKQVYRAASDAHSGDTMSIDIRRGDDTRHVVLHF